MKKLAALLALSVGLLLYGCGSGQALEEQDALISKEEAAAEGNGEVSESEGTDSSENITETKTPEDANEETEGKGDALVVQGGPYGQISISLPEGWEAKACPVDDGSLVNGMYGIRFYPEAATEGGIELSYIDFFGVCGTGLSEETAVIAGSKASIGTYDGHAYWDFISFQEEYEGIVALTLFRGRLVERIRQPGHGDLKYFVF